MDWQEWLQSLQVIGDLCLRIWLRIKSSITFCLIWCYTPKSLIWSIFNLSSYPKSIFIEQLYTEIVNFKSSLKKLLDQFDFRDLIEDLIMITIPWEIVIWLRSWLFRCMIWWIKIWGFDLGFFRTLHLIGADWLGIAPGWLNGGHSSETLVPPIVEGIFQILHFQYFDLGGE